MKKLLLGTLTVLIFALAGCSSEDSNGEPLSGSSYTGQNAAGDTRTITFKPDWQCENKLVYVDGNSIISNPVYSNKGGSVRLYDANGDVATGTLDGNTLTLNFLKEPGNGSWTLTKK